MDPGPRRGDEQNEYKALRFPRTLVRLDGIKLELATNAAAN
jgi:hypothetical protein